MPVYVKRADYDLPFFRLSIKAHLRCHSCGCLLAYVSTRCGAILVVPSIWTFLNSLWFSSKIVFVEFINKLGLCFAQPSTANYSIAYVQARFYWNRGCQEKLT